MFASMLRFGGGARLERPLTFLMLRGLRSQAPKPLVGDGLSSSNAQTKPLAAKSSAQVVSDVLLEAMVNANHTSKLLEIVALNKSSLSGPHVLKALERFSQLNRSTSNDRRESSAPATSAVSKVGATDKMHQTLLSALCERLVRTSRHLNPNEFVNALKHLLALGVSPQSVVFQTVLQHLRTEMNNLRLKQLFFLNFLLVKWTQHNAEMMSTGLLAAIKEAIPLIVKNNLRAQIDTDDVQELLQMFEFGIRYRFHWKDLQLVTKALEVHCPLSLEDSMSVIWSVIQKDNGNLWAETAAVVDPIMRFAIDVAVLNIYRIDQNKLLALVCRLAERGYYLESLFSACCNRVYQTPREWPLTSLSRLMGAFAIARYVNIKILDEYCYSLSNVDDVRCIETIPAHEIVTPFSVANYKPPLLQPILDRWCSRQPRLKWDSDIAGAMRFLLELEILDCCNSKFELPTDIKDSSSLFDFLRDHAVEGEARRSLLREGLLLLQSKLLRRGDTSPSNEGELFDRSAIAKILNEPLEERPTLEVPSFGTALRQALGKDYVVLDSLLSARTGTHFDHLIVSRSHWQLVGGSKDDSFGPGDFVPLALDNPHANKRNSSLVILLRGPTDYAVNARRLLGRPSLEADVLSNIGHRVVQISLEQWNEMQEHERLPYLRTRVAKAEILQ